MVSTWHSDIPTSDSGRANLRSSDSNASTVPGSAGSLIALFTGADEFSEHTRFDFLRAGASIAVTLVGMIFGCDILPFSTATVPRLLHAGRSASSRDRVQTA